ncbi:hypothetical protein GUJ93_ZPchr0007g4353 [Zizania palustris]|uniref:Uncharacterized protein n=1 Tax=Zizania palustris TaxID=103762 RepID=A0A8J5STS4_ZIZPA|nr:hypothetical protein GUJ93_ZPchr0007g4353 [Zizania palustris]
MGTRRRRRARRGCALPGDLGIDARLPRVPAARAPGNEGAVVGVQEEEDGVVDWSRHRGIGTSFLSTAFSPPFV